MSLRILHTSDWHIGKKLKEHDRSEEFRKFFEWLKDIIKNENIDALIVSGDVFDTHTPSAEAQEIYYSFLAEAAGNLCRHIVITAGNHDSALFIDAPEGIMRRCNINVIGRSRKEEVIPLNDESGRPEMIVCAVPFLRDRDLRTVKENDTFSDAGREIKTGIMNHYAGIFDRAREMRGENDIPIIATGHLFLEAGSTMTDEGERSLYLGNAIKVGTDIFPEDIAYVALGHLHSPQEIGRKNIRYSGSPIHMTFGELGVKKTVSVVDFDGRNFAGVNEIEIPVWQKMARVSGDMAGIERDIHGLVGLNESVWAEVTYTGEESPGNLQERLNEILESCPNVEILSVIDEMKYWIQPGGIDDFKDKTLDEIEPLKMLQRMMANSGKIPEEKRPKMEELYREILQEVKAEEK